MRIFVLIIGVLASNFILAFSQENNSNFESKSNLYLGQKLPGNIPEVFAAGIVSTEAYEFGGSFSPDGKEFFFTRRPTYQGSANRIFTASFTNNKWEKPQLAPFAKDVFEFEPFLTPDGQRLYFYSGRKGLRNDIYDGDLWYLERKGENPLEAHFFSSPVNKKYVMTVSSSKSGTLYFSGIFSGKRGIFKSEDSANGYHLIEFLPEEINSLDGAHPFIAPDESYIIFDSQVTGMGKPELYISFKNKDGFWSKAINMGPTINSTKTEFAAFVSPDGKYLFFSRRENGNGEIFWVDAKIIQDLKPDELKD